MHVQWSADSRRYMQSESPDKKRNKKKEKERQYCARRERSDESVRETGQIESSRRDAYSIRVRTKESPPSPIPDRLLLLPSSAIIIIGSIGLRAGNGALAPPRSSPFYIFFLCRSIPLHRRHR